MECDKVETLSENVWRTQFVVSPLIKHPLLRFHFSLIPTLVRLKYQLMIHILIPNATHVDRSYT